MCEDEVGPCFRRQELNRDERRRDALLTQGHGRGMHNAAVGHNVLIDGVVRTRDPFQRGTVLEAKTGTFFASNPKVHLIMLDFVAATFNKPAAFLGRVGESAEYAFRRGGITALDDEGA